MFVSYDNCYAIKSVEFCYSILSGLNQSVKTFLNPTAYKKSSRRKCTNLFCTQSRQTLLQKHHHWRQLWKCMEWGSSLRRNLTGCEMRPLEGVLSSVRWNSCLLFFSSTVLSPLTEENRLSLLPTKSSHSNSA